MTALAEVKNYCAEILGVLKVIVVCHNKTVIRCRVLELSRHVDVRYRRRGSCC